MPNMAVLGSEGLPQYLHWHPVWHTGLRQISLLWLSAACKPCAWICTSSRHFPALCQATCTAAPVSWTYTAQVCHRHTCLCSILAPFI